MTQVKMLVGRIGLLLGVLVALPSLAFAGGWSVVTLDRVPASVQPAVPFTVGFVVRQHGVHPLGGLTPKIILTNPTTGATVTVSARAEGAEGHYVATLRIPSAGRWNWQIEAFGPTAMMSPLDVQAPVPQSAPVVEPQAAAPWSTDAQSWLVGMLFIGGATLSSLLAMYRRRWRVPA